MIKDFVDHTFVLNLDKRPDRLAKITKELEKIELEFERFSAISAEDFDNDIKNVPAFEIHKINREASSEYLMAMYGAKKSHMVMLEIAKKRGYKKILILEDDSVFHENANDIFDKAINQMEDGEWDLLHLGANQRKPFIKINENLCKIRMANANFAYIIPESMYDVLLEGAPKSGKILDQYVAEEIHSNYECFCIRPHIVWQVAGFSDILQKHVNYDCILRK